MIANRLVNLTFVILLTFLSIQCIASTIGIIFKNLSLALLIGAIVLVNMMFFVNYTLKFDNTFFIFISEFNILYYNYNSILFIIYGFGRCPPGYQSRQLIEYGMDVVMFAEYLNRFIIYYFVIVIIELLVFNLKIYKSLFNWHSINRSSVISHDHFDSAVICITEELNNNSLESQKVNEKVFIYWKDLTFFKNRFLSYKDPIKLLDNLFGYFNTYSMNAVMGPSGAGKTTFLKCLSGINRRGISEETKIHVICNRKVKSCFIAQNVSDHLLKGLTVRQTLLYASKLKNSNVITKLDHKKNVEELMSKLSISDISDNRIERCSGGEQKRVLVAEELTSFVKPNLFFIDEPTSGLDSSAAEQVIKRPFLTTLTDVVYSFAFTHPPE